MGPVLVVLRQAEPASSGALLWIEIGSMRNSSFSRQLCQLCGSRDVTPLPRQMQGCSSRSAAPWGVCSIQLCLLVLSMEQHSAQDLPHTSPSTQQGLGPPSPSSAWPPPSPGAWADLRQHCPCAHRAQRTEISFKDSLGGGKQPGHHVHVSFNPFAVCPVPAPSSHGKCVVVVMLSRCPCSPSARDHGPGEGAGPAEAAGHLGRLSHLARGEGAV